MSNFFNILENIIEDFEINGFAPYCTQYIKYWIHNDQKIQIKTQVDHIQSAIIKGVTSQGYLYAIDDFGNIHELYPDGNSLNIKECLITRKY